MNRTSAPPRPIGATVPVLLALLWCLALPAAASAAPEGESPLAISPAPAEFAKTTVGFQSSSQDFEVLNAGPETVGVDGAYVDGADSGQFNFQGTDCGSLEPGESCTVQISFSPHSEGLKQATLRVVASGHDDATAALSGTGVPAQLEFTPGSYDFGTRWVYESTEATLQLTNSGEARVQLSGIDVVGPDTGAFWNGYSDCWSGPEGWLEAGASCSVQVHFQPHDTRDFEAGVKASVHGDGFTATLTGRGGQALMVPDSNPVDFGAVTTGGFGTPRTIEITNHGDIAGAFFIAVVAGGDAGSFDLLDEDCSGAPVEPGHSCHVRIRFAPQDAGPRQARLALFGDNDGGTMIALRGDGIASAATLSPGWASFGARRVGRRSKARWFVVRNEAAAPIVVNGVALVGADPDQFLLAGDECTGEVLAAGQECRARVRFAPDSRGLKTARLRVAGTAGTLTALLRGRGKAARPAAGERRKKRFRFRHNRAIGGKRPGGKRVMAARVAGLRR